MASDDSAFDPVGPLAEEFVARYRRGERPDLSEYTDRYPELAERIRQVFPMMVLMEEAGPDVEPASSGTGVALRQSTAKAAATRERLGGYRILREVGRGGMGVVYEAEQVALGRHVALKVLPLHTARGGKALERFRREARAAARLHHSNIVPVFEVGEAEGLCFYAMQFIHGQPLDQVLDELCRLRAASGGRSPAPPQTDVPGELGNPPTPGKTIAMSLLAGRPDRLSFEFSPQRGVGEGPPPVSTPVLPGQTDPSAVETSRWPYYRSVAQVGVQVAEALEYAHSEGVLHRDIKPSNLLLDSEGRVWVTDFGLAKTDGDALTQAGDVVGTIPYMAPERFRGWSDPRSDVYGLGLTLYEMLALRPAFSGVDRYQLIHQVTQEEPLQLRKVDPQVPRDLETIIAKAMEKEPSRRYASAGELAEDLRRFLEERPILARRTGALERTWLWCRRNPVVALWSVAFVLALVVGLVGMTWQWLRAEESAAQARASAETARVNAGIANERRVEAEGNLDRALKAEEELKEQLWQSYFDKARALLYSGQPGQRYESLQAVAAAARLHPAPELLDLAIASLALTDIRLGKPWESWHDDTSSLVFDARLERYACADAKGNISIHSVADDTKRFDPLPGPGSGTELFLRFSPDGNYLAAFYHHPRLLQVWDLARRETKLKRSLRDSAVFVFTPDSRRLVVGDSNGSIDLYDVATGTHRHVCKGPAEPRLAVSPHDNRLAIAGNQPLVVQVRDLETGAVVAEWNHPAREVNDVAWHPHDRNLLATAGGGIFLWDARTGKQRAALPGQAGPTTNIAFSHQGDVLASQGFFDTTLRLWDPWTGRQLVQTLGTATNCSLTFSPDDRWLAFARSGRQIGLWEVASSREFRSLAGHARINEGAYTQLDVSPDGRILAASSRAEPGPNGVRFWDLTTGREVGFLPIGWTNDVHFHPRGGGLFTAHLQAGVHFWPIQADPDSGVWRVGPPRSLGFSGHEAWFSLNQDGQRLAVRHGDSITVLPVSDLAQPSPAAAWPGGSLGEKLQSWFGGSGGRIRVSQPGLSTLGLDLSPDGRWLITWGYHYGHEIRIWDARTLKPLEPPLPLVTGRARAEFSPDGKWLVVAGASEYRIYETGSWQLRHEFKRDAGGDLAGPLAFRGDGKVLALSLSGFTVRLIDPATGRVFANLESPERDRGIPRGLRFSPDGRRLAVCMDMLRMIHVWDLQRIGERLAEMGLPWELPPSPPPPASADSKPVRVEGNLGDFAGQEHRDNSRAQLAAEQWQKALDEASKAIALFQDDVEAWRLRAEARIALKQYDQALADYRHSVKLGGYQAQTENKLAWRLVAAPDVRADLVAQAIEWARRAIFLTPGEGSYWNTLGVAHYRAGNWDEAIKVLQKSNELLRGRDLAYSAFFLAMAHWQRGQVTQARSWQERAIDWMAKHEPDNRELQRFRDEAITCARAALRLELEKLTRTIQDNPRDGDAHYRRGLVHRDLARHAQARDDFSQALAINPEHVEAYHHRGHAHERLGQWEKARDDFTAALQRYPRQANFSKFRQAHFYDMRGLAHQRLRDHDQAARDWEKSLDLAPNQHAVGNDLAWLYATGPQQLRDAAKALPLAERANKLAPNTYTYLTTLGVVHYRLGQSNQAVQTLTRAAGLRKHGPTAFDRFVLAMSYHRLGEAVKARDCYDEALAWWKAQPRLTEFQVEQLNALRAEAEALLNKP